MAAPLLELRAIGKRFGENFSLQDISLAVNPGEVHVIAGENGSGKSALMKIISGIFQPDGGEILMDGQAVDFKSVNEARAAGIVFQHQSPQLYENLSVAENVFFNSFGTKRNWRLILNPYHLHDQCLQLFKRLGLIIDPAAKLMTLGYTQRMVVSACQACVAPGRLVIFDEPTAGMTDTERTVFFRIVEELRGRGMAMFYISHKLDEIRRIGTRVTVLQNGRISGSLSGTDADRNTVIHLMTGHPCPERYPRLAFQPGPVVLVVENLKSGDVLKDVSFSIRKGEIVGLTGLMGSGRSRLASCLFGDSKPDAGRILREGREVQFSNTRDALRSGIALIPENRSQNAIFPHQDVLANLIAAALPRFQATYGLDTRYMEELSSDYVRSLGILPGHINDIVNWYSGGNQQKIIIARWLMSFARIFIMDEPTSGIDAAARIDIYNAMNDLVTKGASILFISSEIEEIMGMCDRILVLAGGNIVADLARGSATKEKILDFASLE